MPTGRITKSSTDAAQPGEKDWMLWDDRLSGFGLKVTPAGAKIFVFQYRMGGRGSPVRRFTVGKFGKLTADGARRVADGLALKVAQDIDPQREKVENVRRSIDLAFKPYVERFHAGCLLKEWKATHQYSHSLLLRHAVPVLGNKPLPDITRRDIKAVLAPVLDKTATASNLFSVLRRLFSWAVEHEDIERSPIEGMKPPPLPKARDRVLMDWELALVWRATGSMGYPFGPMVRLLLLTGARREEIAALDWSELNRDARMWSLPAARSKNDKPLEAPLSSMAVAELNELAMRSGKDGGWPSRGLVFSTTGHSAVSGYSRAKRRLDGLIAALARENDSLNAMDPWRLHDLRRTLATGLQRLGVRLEVTEAVLNHVSGSKSGIVGVYQRHEWKEEKAAALEAWAGHIEKLLTGTDRSNVIELAQVRA